MPESIHQRVERVLRSPGDETALEELRQLAPEYRAELLESPIEPAEDPSPELLEWVGRVYEALGEALEDPLPDSFWTAEPSELSDVGNAFANALVVDLPEALTDFEKRFGSVDGSASRPLLRREDVRAAGAWGERLASAGLSPLTIHLATEAVSGLVDRLMRHEELEKAPMGLSFSGEPLLAAVPGREKRVGYAVSSSDMVALVDDVPAGVFARVRTALETPVNVFRRVVGIARPSAVAKPDAVIDRELLVEEIGAVADCSEAVAGAMLSWLVEVAVYRPLLFRHFKAQPAPDGIELQHLGFVLGASQIPPTESEPDDLMQRWGLALDSAHTWLSKHGVALERRTDESVPMDAWRAGSPRIQG